MKIQIKEISYYDTWSIRHQVMWPDKNINYIKLTNDDEGKHFGLFVGKKLVSVISLFTKQRKTQFRKFATLSEEQGKGYGAQLLNYIFSIIEKSPVQVLWCNARKDKTSFYKTFGFIETDQKFHKGGIEYIIMKVNL
ncbi:GNAT family N-acetyltransferase [Croceitalea rosinachiae]|uniref:GNAT family N-acetyltransferase n=1 Tax=Croceitalea rosinachiae TaxID=3075596 RepID=A0ABU3AAA4_9FLAO|nr:GNAT family N-acetyltransferase [Croceitalea sp. F388]MDT0607118.1 GNAT family N-acetyltransferase [Croceitalea sp. F388]